MTRSPSVQTVHLALEAIDEDVLCLRRGQHRAVLEVGSVTFGLQGEAEQEAIIASFAACLNSLTFPVQVLVRVLPIDIAVHLADLEHRAHHLSADLADLARDYLAFLQRLARNRTLLERRFYLVVPAQLDAATPRGWWPSRQKRQSGSLDAARRQLTFRCEEIERQLGRCGLPVRRLAGGELAQLVYACWCPELAHVQRLGKELIALDSPVVAASTRSPRRS
ncbi:MAG: hypothetical protein JOZ41_03755 [Chloroflexi bacterium]|nr:hypothetical protein [Chloroflexota bacterium]